MYFHTTISVKLFSCTSGQRTDRRLVVSVCFSHCANLIFSFLFFLEAHIFTTTSRSIVSVRSFSAAKTISLSNVHQTWSIADNFLLFSFCWKIFHSLQPSLTGSYKLLETAIAFDTQIPGNTNTIAAFTVTTQNIHEYFKFCSKILRFDCEWRWKKLNNCFDLFKVGCCNWWLKNMSQRLYLFLTLFCVISVL